MQCARAPGDSPSYCPPALILPRARINEGLVKCNRAEAQGGPSGRPAWQQSTSRTCHYGQRQIAGYQRRGCCCTQPGAALFPGAVGGVVLEDTVGPPAACTLAGAAD